MRIDYSEMVEASDPQNFWSSLGVGFLGNKTEDIVLGLLKKPKRNAQLLSLLHEKMEEIGIEAEVETLTLNQCFLKIIIVYGTYRITGYGPERSGTMNFQNMKSRNIELAIRYQTDTKYWTAQNNAHHVIGISISGKEHHDLGYQSFLVDNNCIFFFNQRDDYSVYAEEKGPVMSFTLPPMNLSKPTASPSRSRTRIRSSICS